MLGIAPSRRGFIKTALLSMTLLAGTGMPAYADAGFQRWIANFEKTATSNGISRQTYRAVFAGVTEPDHDVIRSARFQPEFRDNAWDYMDNRVNEETVADGRRLAQQHKRLLDVIEQRFGVSRYIVLAIWSMESSYGKALEKPGSLKHVPQALATLAYLDERRAGFARQQLIGALKIVQAGHVSPKGLTGSWAGAMGHTQFMPTSYLEYAVDFTGDGRRDIWSDDPTDALASTAHYLRQNGWQPGQPWGAEVILPSGFDYNQVSKSVEKSGSQWTAMGVRTASGRPVPSGAIIAPAGARGPAFVITQNFRAILKYNASDSYALAVSFLGDAIAGRPGIQGAWPRGDRTLSNSEKAEIQRLLMARGFDTGGADGKLGAKSVEAVKGFQRSRGMVPDGYADANLLALLRG